MMPPADTVRVFVALDIPPAAKDTLSETIRQLKVTIASGVRWVDPGGIHLTLKFLGNVDAAIVDDLLCAMKQASQEFQKGKFDLRLSSLGLFPNENQPRVLWAGTDGNLEALENLQLLVDVAISRLGFSREKRAFRPHLTIGRVQDRVPPQARRFIGEAVLSTQLPTVDPWKVDAVHLIRSTLTPSGAIYNSLGFVSL